MKNIASENITIEIDYARPYFVFPELNYKEGNSVEYFKIAKIALNNNGFTREGNELYDLKYTPYPEHFNIIARFLDYKNSYAENETFTYLKDKKNNLIELIKQPHFFKINNQKEILQLIAEKHDFSIKNCYGRTHLHYLTDIDSLNELLKLNKNKNWFDLFELDVFNSTYLHQRDLTSLNIILEHMIEKSIEMTKFFFYGTNVFGNNAFSIFLNEFVNTFKSNINPSENIISEISKTLAIIYKFDTNKFDEFLNAFAKIENNKSKKIRAEMFSFMLEQGLHSNNTKINKCLKI